MNLNPFELRANDYCVKDMYKKDEDYSWGLEVNDEVGKLFNEEYGSYEYLIKGINVSIEWRSMVRIGSYQGDLFCLGVSTDNKYYFVNTGYGSCSGCDWYCAKEDSIEGLQEIQDGLKKDVKEFDTLEDFIEWFSSEDRYTNEWWGTEDRDEFLIDVKEKYQSR